MANAETGEAAKADVSWSPDQDYHEIHYQDLTVSLLDLGDQKTLDVRFPVVVQTKFHEPLSHEAYWTNHPECVTKTWIEERQGATGDYQERWFHLLFDLKTLVD
jgi:hypothetical protein